MGDRCYLTVRVKTDDLKEFLRLMGLDDSFVIGDNGATSIVDVDEANYAMSYELDTANHAGIQFMGWHGAGDEYGEEAFVSMGKRGVMYYPESHGYPMLRLNANCTVGQGILRVMQKTFKARCELSREFDRLDAKAKKAANVK